MKILFVGSNPSQRSNSIEAFWTDTKSYSVLSNWKSNIIFSDKTTFHYANSYNLVTPNNRPLKVSEIRAGSSQLMAHLENIKPTHIVALGKTAAKALLMIGVDFYEMPHPSPLNRKLNDKSFIEEKIKGLQSYLNPL